MKKLLSVLLSITMLFSVVVPFSALANTNDDIHADMASEVQFCGLSKLDVSASVDAYTAARAGKLDEKTYLASLDKSLSENKGKVMITDYYTQVSKEDVTVYAAIVNILYLLNYNPTNYKGYDLVKAFKNVSDKTVSNPYYYRVIVEACENTNNKAYAKTFINEFIKNYYTLGQGMNYWGFSCDNTAVFLTAIAPYKADYSKYVTDATKVIESYATNGGYGYSKEYPDLSADSTAVTMMAYAAIGDSKKAEALRSFIMNNYESKTNNGVMVCWGAENAYTTKEVLLALTYMHLVKTYSASATCTKAGVIRETKCTACNKVLKKGTPIKALGHNCQKITKKSTYFEKGYTADKCKRCGALLNKKTVKKLTLAKPTATVTPSSKAFKVSYKKITGATGYQIQYSTNSKFNSASSKKTTSLSKSVTGLKANKKYYVRVRAYRTEKGKGTVYSSWSSAKSVTTKK